MQDVPLTDDPPVRAGGAVLRAQGRHHGDRRRARAGDVRRVGASGPVASAGVLDTLGISADGRVATFAWNTARHLELYFAAPCTGRVLHTLNIRLFPEQLTYIVNHADDEVIFVDRSLLALLAPLLPTFERRPPPRADGRRQGRGARRPRTATSCSTTRSCSPPRRRSSSRRRRAPGRQHVLHERHDGQPQGRRVQPPQHVPAHDGRDDRRLRSASASPTASCRSCRCSTPTRGASPTPASRPAPT